MNEPIDVQKTLAAYGAELDELRVWCRKQEERIVILEKQVAWLAVFQDRQVKQMMREDAPKAALEAQAGPEYAPGFMGHHSGAYEVGISGSDIGISLTYYFDLRTIEFSAFDEADGVEFDLTPKQLRELIGAAMAVLKRMESEGESRDSV